MKKGPILQNSGRFKTVHNYLQHKANQVKSREMKKKVIPLGV